MFSVKWSGSHLNYKISSNLVTGGEVEGEKWLISRRSEVQNRLWHFFARIPVHALKKILQHKKTTNLTNAHR